MSKFFCESNSEDDDDAPRGGIEPETGKIE